MVCQQVTITLHRYREVYFGVLNSIKIVRNSKDRVRARRRSRNFWTYLGRGPSEETAAPHRSRNVSERSPTQQKHYFEQRGLQRRSFTDRRPPRLSGHFARHVGGMVGGIASGGFTLEHGLGRRLLTSANAVSDAH